MLRLAVTSAVMLLVITAAHAEKDDPKALFERATVEFRLGRFHDAARTYERVYELHPDPALLFNCAQSYRLANEPDKALTFYKSFLSAKPDAANKEEVQARIVELERAVAEQKKAVERPPNEIIPPTREAPPAAAPVAPPPAAAATSPSAPTAATHAGRTKKIAGIALLGGAVALAVGGVVAAVFSGKESDSINSAAQSGQPFDPAREAAGHNDTVISGVMFGVAGAAAVAGGVLLALGIRDGRTHERAVSLAPIASPSAVGGLATVRF